MDVVAGHAHMTIEAFARECSRSKRIYIYIIYIYIYML